MYITRNNSIKNKPKVTNIIDPSYTNPIHVPTLKHQNITAPQLIPLDNSKVDEESNFQTTIHQKDHSIDKIESEYSLNQTQQSTIHTKKTPSSIQTSHKQSPDIAYTQYYNITNETPTDNDINSIHRVPVVEQDINMNSPLLDQVHKVSSTEPQTKSFNLDLLLRTIGYQKAINFLKHYKTVGLDTIFVNNLGTEQLKYLGMFSTMSKR